MCVKRIRFNHYVYYKSVHKYIVKSSITSKTTHDFTHIYASTFKHTIVNTVVCTKFADNALKLSIVKNPVQEMSV